ncbi:dephospho-CoA kinase domain-containing protein-like [Amphiura filiformis]|uniref:dephospho-CoA kinase domain-containing protein-like n=1 Tax=Amphiura filiformis TaxID=82378 RepID=UPI003B21169A
MFLIGLTGGIASGKSTVANYFRDLGVTIIDADKIARKVVEPHRPAWKLIVRHFGEEILLEDGSINRAKLGTIIFADHSKRRVLNSCTHPYIQREMFSEIVKCFIRGEHYAILDIPLLYEGSKLLSFINQVIVVYCDKENQLFRLMARNYLTKEEAQQRIDAQMSLDKKCDLADHVIDNNQTKDRTKEAVLNLHAKFQQSWIHWKLRLVLIGLVLCLCIGFYHLACYMGG